MDMRVTDIENWALSIIDRVKSRQPIEDTRVELKAQYPDDVKKAARRIAGHANAARGEHILWLIGVDEGAGTIPGALLTDFASWYMGVKAEFDELAPEPISVNIPIDGATVVALYFETDRAPFVVKNPQGGTVQHEVPWREATSVKSASRSQLLRLLTPIQRLPTIEVVACLLSLSWWKSQPGKKFLSFELLSALFLTQPTNQETVFPRHRSETTITIPDLDSWSFTGQTDFYGLGANNMNATETFISIRGSGLFEARMKVSIEKQDAEAIVNDDTLFASGMMGKLALYSVEAERMLTIDIEPDRMDHYKEKRQWRQGSHSFMTSPRR